MINGKILFLSFTLILAGCGSGGGSDNSNTETSIVQENNKINNVELGPVRGANVAISTLNGQQFLYSTVTDVNGKYTIDVNEFNINLESLTVYPQYVLVTATNGVDIDPEDDGDTTNSSPVAVNGTVKGIFKTSILQNNEDLSINLLSTAISEVLKDKEKIDDEQIAYVAKELGMEDINGDGKIDNKDIYLYRMSEYETDIEAKLRENFLGAIHDGDNDKIEEISNELREQYNLMFISYIISDSTAKLSIEKSKKDSQIMYKVNAKKNDILNNVYLSSINLQKNDYIVYKECKNNKCSVVQIASFDGKVVHQFFLRVSDFGIYENIEYMNGLRKSINDDSRKIQNLQSEISIINDNIKNSEDKIDEINLNIEDIKNDNTDYEL